MCATDACSSQGGIVLPMANHVATTLSHRPRGPAPLDPAAYGPEPPGRTAAGRIPVDQDPDLDNGDLDNGDLESAGPEADPLESGENDTAFTPDPNAPPDPVVIAQIEAEIPRLRRFARAMVRDATLADDLVQECLERALSRLHLWRPGSNLRAWLFTILRNLHINGVRRRQPVVDIDAEAQAAIGAAPGSQFVRLELRDLRRALGLLPNEQREVVLLIGLEGISYGEAADILGISIGTVKSRLSRGRRALRLLMEGRSLFDDDDA